MSTVVAVVCVVSISVVFTFRGLFTFPLLYLARQSNVVRLCVLLSPFTSITTTDKGVTNYIFFSKANVTLKPNSLAHKFRVHRQQVSLFPLGLSFPKGGIDFYSRKSKFIPWTNRAEKIQQEKSENLQGR